MSIQPRFSSECRLDSKGIFDWDCRSAYDNSVDPNEVAESALNAAKTRRSRDVR
jgi:hypothetical protein